MTDLIFITTKASATMRTLLLSFMLCVLFSCKKNEVKPIDPLLTSNEFLIKAGGKETELVNDMFVDNNDNIYLTGVARYNKIGDSLNFGNKIVKSLGGEDAFIVKYDRYGNASWAKLIGSAGWDEGEVIAVDGKDNCFVAGFFGGQINFGNSFLSPKVISNPSGLPNKMDMFLAKYDPQGKELWVKQVSGPGYERPTSLLVDKTGNLFITGYFYQNANFGATTLTTSGSSFFLAKYANNGSLLWVKSFGVSAYGSLYPTDLKLDNNDNLIIAGSFEGPQVIGSYNIQSNGYQDVFTAKIDNNGVVQWVKTFGGGNYENCNALAIDRTNNIYIGGMFKQSISIGGFTINSTGNSPDAFFVKLTSTGNVEWMKSASGRGEKNVQDMFIKNDTLYSVGSFNEDFAIENRIVSANNWNAFITKHDLAGALSGLVVMNLNNGVPKNIYVDKSNYSTITGYFSNSISFENMSVGSLGSFDLFLLKKKLPFK